MKVFTRISVKLNKAMNDDNSFDKNDEIEYVRYKDKTKTRL